MNKLIIVILFIIITSLQYKLWLKEDGIQSLVKVNQLINQQELELKNLRARNEQLSSTIKLIKQNPKAIEEHARIVFGMVKKDETYYRIIE